jgi:hypothetical protein
MAEVKKTGSGAGFSKPKGPKSSGKLIDRLAGN